MTHCVLLLAATSLLVIIVGASHRDLDRDINIFNCCTYMPNPTECIEICTTGTTTPIDTVSSTVYGVCCEQFNTKNSNSHSKRYLENKQLGHEPFVKISNGDRWRIVRVEKPPQDDLTKLTMSDMTTTTSSTILNENTFQEIEGSHPSETTSSHYTTSTTPTFTPSSSTVSSTSSSSPTTSAPTSTPNPASSSPATTTRRDRRIAKIQYMNDKPWNVFLTKHYYRDEEGQWGGLNFDIKWEPGSRK